MVRISKSKQLTIEEKAEVIIMSCYRKLETLY